MFSNDSKLLISTALSGVFEYYDFIIFILMSKLLANIFLNNNGDISYILMVFSGYFARFLGGIVFSFISKKYGVNKTFFLSIVLMFISCLLISITPSYNKIGYFSVIFLFIFRSIQGASLGGEIPLAVVFSIRNKIKMNPYFISSILFFGFSVGTLLAKLLVYLLYKYYNTNEIYDFAWRIPFLLGSILMIISYFIRTNLKLKKQIIFKNEESGIDLIKSFKKCLYGILLISPPTLLYNIAYFQGPVFLRSRLNSFSEKDSFYINIGIFLTAIISVMSSFLKNYFNRYNLTLLLSILYIPMLFNFYFSEIVVYRRLSFLLLSIPLGLMFSGIYSKLYDLYKNKSSIILISLSINIPNIFFSSTCYPSILLFDRYKLINYFGLYVIFIFIISFYFLYFRLKKIEEVSI